MSILLQFLVSCLLVFSAFSCFSVPNIKLPNRKLSTAPSVLIADYVEYNEEEQLLYAKGNITLIVDKYTLSADLVCYDLKAEQLLAQGAVTMSAAIMNEGRDKILLGDEVFFKDKLKVGIITNFILKFTTNNALLVAKLAKRYSQQADLYDVHFTPCTVACGGKPIWQLSAKETHLDLEKERIIYKGVSFAVYGLPIFFTPYFAHPTPDAKAQSGMLMPSIKRNSLSAPVYWRVKPNMDFTLTPRFANRYLIFELEGRHKLLNGDYAFNASYGHVPYKAKKISSTALSARGDFYRNNAKYGFNLNYASDKAYLKNYYDQHDSYLLSRWYFNNVDNYNYLTLEGMHFQDLRAEDFYKHGPLILPSIKSKAVIDLKDDQSTALIIENDILNYYAFKKTQVIRAALNLSLISTFKTLSGYVFDVIASNRSDLYFSKNQPSNIKGRTHKTRNIPEMRLRWRYPLIKQVNDMRVIFEPVVLATTGLRFQERYNKYGSIDPGQCELAEDNFFAANRYSGIDFHEYGKRLSYGAHLTTLANNSYYQLFLGQFLHKGNTSGHDNVGNVGRLSVNFAEIIELFYRFRRDKYYKPIRDEVGLDLWYDRFKLTTTLINLKNLDKYYTLKNFPNLNNKATQTYYSLQYACSPNWSINHELRLDIGAKKIRPLYRSIKVTYFKDCVSVSVELAHDYTCDHQRGIKRNYNKSISIGLKTLNM